MIVTSRGILFCQSSNNASSSTPYRVVSKRKAIPEEKYNEESPASIVDDSSFYLLVIEDDFKMGDMSGGNCSMNNHTLSKKDCDSNDGDVISGYGF